MVLDMRESGMLNGTCEMEEDSKFGLMARSMKATGETIKLIAKED